MDLFAVLSGLFALSFSLDFAILEGLFALFDGLFATLKDLFAPSNHLFALSVHLFAPFKSYFHRAIYMSDIDKKLGSKIPVLYRVPTTEFGSQSTILSFSFISKPRDGVLLPVKAE